MASTTAAKVTIDRAYFETLLRRATLDSNSTGLTGGLTVPTVTIPRTEYEHLQSIEQKHENLRRNLLDGGVELDTLNCLCGQATATDEVGQPAPSVTTQDESLGGTPLDFDTLSASLHTPIETVSTFQNGLPMSYTQDQSRGHMRSYNNKDWAGSQDDTSESNTTPNEMPRDFQQIGGESFTHQKPHFERLATRTIIMSNLPDRVTHSDITAVVRGGQLLEIFLRSYDHSATVSFVHAADAKCFHDHVRRHDLYIQTKRVEVRWSERQFILPGHVAHQVGYGATRNLVIRRCDSKHTEASIRDDLEHIHNLAVLKVDFIGGDCFIKTNSVHNAMYAKTCMMSRLKYKGSKIEWDVDECAQPLGMVPEFRPPSKEAPPSRKPLNPRANRFQLLNEDDSGSDTESETPPVLHRIDIPAR